MKMSVDGGLAIDRRCDIRASQARDQMKDFGRGISIPEERLSNDIDEDGDRSKSGEEQQDALVYGKGVPKVFAIREDFCQEAHFGDIKRVVLSRLETAIRLRQAMGRSGLEEGGRVYSKRMEMSICEARLETIIEERTKKKALAETGSSTGKGVEGRWVASADDNGNGVYRIGL